MAQVCSTSVPPFTLCCVQKYIHVSMTVVLQLLSYVALATIPLTSGARAFLGQSDTIANAWAALNFSLGCGEGSQDVQSIQVVLTPMWRSMPQDSEGQVEIRSLRYMASRYFSQTSSLRLRGFDPAGFVEQFVWDKDEISKRVPSFASVDLSNSRFTFDDAVVYVAVLQDIIFGLSDDVLDRVFGQRAAANKDLSSAEVVQLLDKYVLHWMAGDAFDGECFHPPGQQNNLCFEVPMKNELQALVRAQVKALDHTRNHNVRKFGHSVMELTYSRNDAQAISTGISKNFAWFYQSDCAQMKNRLVRLDVGRIGRVPLSKFYGASEFFGESEHYLDAQGVLDYAVSAREPYVVIPNYMLAASNCIVATSDYQICCANPCEGILGDIEQVVRASEATVNEMITIISDMLDVDTFEDKPLKLSDSLKDRLRAMGEMHEGQIRLHSRLFAQWLHYVFPRECPFPHKSGSINMVSAMEYTGVVEVQLEEKAHLLAAAAGMPDKRLDNEVLDWMNQWDDHEEFLAGYRSPSGFSFRHIILVVGGVLVVLIGAGGWRSQSQQRETISASSKSLWV
uniref:Uncharacterized protein n=1 Tax=Noctiluca scintillans TaxID=2966 RepID=A0A7S1F0B7_NOCSC